MPARLLVKEASTVADRPPDQLSELRGEHPCWLDIADPKGEDLRQAASELDLHPLALEDAQHQHQRPKIDEYDDTTSSSSTPRGAEPDVIRHRELGIFVKHNAIVTVHEGSLAALAVVERASAKGKLATTGLLLHALPTRSSTAISDILDGLGDRVELIEAMVIDGDPRDSQTSIASCSS